MGCRLDGTIRLHEKVKKAFITKDRFFLILSGFLLSLFIFIPWADGKLPFQAFYGESLTQWIPFRLFMLHNYEAGIFPLWNPYIFGGMPFWAYSHTMSAYPVMVFSLLFDLLTGMCVFYLFHIWISCWGAFRLLRFWRFNPLLSMLGTVLIVGSGSGMFNSDFYLVLAALSWFPALIYIGIRLLRSGRSKYFFAWIVLLSFQFLIGDVESAVYSCATVVLFTIVAWPGFSDAFWRGRWVCWLGPVAISFLIAALMWIPLCEYMPHNIRSGGVTLEIYRLFPKMFSLKHVILGAFFHPRLSPLGWPVLFFMGYHLVVRRKRSSWILFGMVVAGYFFFSRESIYIDKMLYNIPLLKSFLRRDQASGGVLFVIHWLSLLGMRDFVESAKSSAGRLPLLILSLTGIGVTTGSILYFKESALGLLSLPLLVYLPASVYCLKWGTRPLGTRPATFVIAFLLLSCNYIALLLSIDRTDVERVTSEPFHQAAERYDSSSRHLFATYMGHGDTELIPQQGMIFDWPQVWGWNRVPPRRYMDLIRLIDPNAIKYENNKLSDMNYVFLHLDGALLRPRALPLLDLINLKYLFDHNMPVKLISPSYVAWMLPLREFKGRRVKDHWRDLLVTNHPLEFDLFARPGQTLNFSLAWDACTPPDPGINSRVKISLDSEAILEKTLRLDCSSGAPGLSSPLQIGLGPHAGSIRTLSIDVEQPKGYALDRFRFHRIRIKNPNMPFQLIYSNNFDIYENKEVLPPQFFVRRIELFPDKDSILRQLEISSRKHLATTALLIDSPEAGRVKRWLERASRGPLGPDRVVMKHHVPGKRVYRVQASRRAILMVSSNRLYGWEVKIDGEEVRLLTVDWAFSGIAVEAGIHTVEMSYRPAGFQVALWVSIGSCLSFLAMALSSGRRKNF